VQRYKLEFCSWKPTYIPYSHQLIKKINKNKKIYKHFNMKDKHITCSCKFLNTCHKQIPFTSSFISGTSEEGVYRRFLIGTALGQLTESSTFNLIIRVERELDWGDLAGTELKLLRDFRLPLQCTWELWSSGLLLYTTTYKSKDQQPWNRCLW
jgi:hypothetical protein